MKSFMVTLLAGALVFAATAADAQQKPMRIRGTITAFESLTIPPSSVLVACRSRRSSA